MLEVVYVDVLEKRLVKVVARGRLRCCLERPALSFEVMGETWEGGLRGRYRFPCPIYRRNSIDFRFRNVV